MIAILQCRLTSNRLPGKLLYSFFDETVLERMINIAKSAKSVSKIIVAFGGQFGSSIVNDIAEKHGVDFFEGDEQNVLSRYLTIANKFENSYILRLTCDNYLIQPLLIDRLYEQVLSDNSEYGYISPLSHYCGEVIYSNSFLEFHKSRKTTLDDEEHVTFNYRTSPQIAKTILEENFYDLDHSNSLTLDKVAIFGMSYKPNVNDFRESPALHIINTLQTQDVDLVVVEPHASERLFDLNFVSTEQALTEVDLCYVLVPHDEFLANEIINHSKMANSFRFVMDAPIAV